MLILTRKTNEKIRIGNDITITIIEVRGDQVKVGVDAPKEIKVFRHEVLQAIQNENKIAVANEGAEKKLSMLSSLLKK